MRETSRPERTERHGLVAEYMKIRWFLNPVLQLCLNAVAQPVRQLGAVRGAMRPRDIGEIIMYIKRVAGPRQVTLPDGSRISRADLPPADTRRWVASRKALVVKAVAYGLIGRDEALERYALSEEEFALWCDAVAQHGEKALKVTSIQKYRQL